MLYSGAWEQPTKTSGATKDEPASGPSEVFRRRSRSVDSIFISGRPQLCFSTESGESLDSFRSCIRLMTFTVERPNLSDQGYRLIP